MTQLHLSRLLLNPRSRQVQRETADPYQRHRTIMRAFPDDLPDNERILHRLDVHPRTGAVLLLVQSRAAPDWTPLQEKKLLQPADPFSGLDNPAVKQFDPALRPGQILNYRLVANPTVKKKREGRKNGTRVPLVREERQLEWLQRKAARNGFRLLHTLISNQQEVKGRKGKGKRPLTIYTVQFDGRLQVADPAKVEAAVQNGVGPAKAFGCGLLSLAPA
jgi:CRISPR system Cascade subunit CasE